MKKLRWFIHSLFLFSYLASAAFAGSPSYIDFSREYKTLNNKDITSDQNFHSTWSALSDEEKENLISQIRKQKMDLVGSASRSPASTSGEQKPTLINDQYFNGIKKQIATILSP
jgi:predicted patatin/cPLA2 family phospholipase